MACLVVYPAQSPAANSMNCWNWFNRKDQVRDRGEPALIAGITREIMSDYEVEPRKVFIAGISAGGAMAVIMATVYPELFAAVGVHSGLAYGAAHNATSAFVALRGRNKTNGETPSASGRRAERPAAARAIADDRISRRPGHDRGPEQRHRGGRSGALAGSDSHGPLEKTVQGSDDRQWSRLHRDHLSDSQPPADRRVLGIARRRTCMVRRIFERILHRRKRTRCLGGDGAILLVSGRKRLNSRMLQRAESHWAIASGTSRCARALMYMPMCPRSNSSAV